MTFRSPSSRAGVPGSKVPCVLRAEPGTRNLELRTWNSELMTREPSKADDITSIARNKRARHDYHILDTWEAGIVLTGTEVKSLRDGKANIGDAYGTVRDGEVYLLNLHISP